MGALTSAEPHPRWMQVSREGSGRQQGADIPGRFQSKALTWNTGVCAGQRQHSRRCLRGGFPGRGSTAGDCFYIRYHRWGLGH